MLSRLECWSASPRHNCRILNSNRQLQSGKGVGEEGYNGMVDCFRKIIKNEGFSRLYRGITAPILMEAPKRYVPPLAPVGQLLTA
jgi:hypothetical protein